MSEAEHFAQARKLFEKFHRRAPDARELVLFEPPRGAVPLLEVGILIGLAYRPRDGQTYYHEFKAPHGLVCVSDSGRQIMIIGGGYRFTERGFIG